MPRVVMYTTRICPTVCAPKPAPGKGREFEELYIDGSRQLMREMLERSKRRTVPQIFIDDYHVGGYDDLAELNAFGKLDPLLGLAPHMEPEVSEEEADPPDVRTGAYATRQMAVGRPFFKTRSLAVAAITGGKVHLNGMRTKPGKEVCAGSRLRIHKDSLEWSVTVMQIPRQRRPASEAVTCYQEDESSISKRER